MQIGLIVFFNNKAPNRVHSRVQCLNNNESSSFDANNAFKIVFSEALMKTKQGQVIFPDVLVSKDTIAPEGRWTGGEVLIMVVDHFKYSLFFLLITESAIS